MCEGFQGVISSGNSQVHSKGPDTGDFADYGSRRHGKGSQTSGKGEGLHKIRHCVKDRVWKRDREQDQRVRDKNGESLVTIDRDGEETVNTGLRGKNRFF